MQRIVPLLLVLLALAGEAVACDAMEEDLAAFLDGSYSLIGREPHFGAAYAGQATLRADGCRMTIVRCIGAERVVGTARVVTVLADEIPMLETRHRIGPRIVLARFHINGDLDNYPLLSGQWVIGDDWAGASGREHWYTEREDTLESEEPQPACE
ncbi:MAG: hypothetical protein QGF53_09275 [Alphaproteobacteria bacterium]|nr:hypothetical protein [Alphaproteobacteria bacterium]